MEMIKEIISRKKSLEISRCFSRDFLEIIPEQKQTLMRISSKTRKGIGRNIYTREGIPLTRVLEIIYFYYINI